MGSKVEDEGQTALDKQERTDIEANGAEDGLVDGQLAYAQVGYDEIFKRFILLGWTAFGGPAAHIAVFQKLFVENLKWMSMTVFTELLALGQCLPGPTSTQMSFAIGVTKKGIPGGLLSGILFQYPGLIMMTILGAGAAEYLVDPADWVRAMAQGFGATGVALVAGAAVSLLTKLCKTRTLQLLAAFSALMAFYHPAAWMFPSLIAVGGIVVLVQTWKEPLKKSDYEEHVENLGLNIWGGLVLILVWIGLLVGFIAARDQTDYSDDANKPIHWFEAFFRIGSLIFGGGQVVLPMLVDEVVQLDCTVDAGGVETCVEAADTWMTLEQFLAGLGVAQAMPGPLFNISAYLGAVIAIRANMSFALGTAVCWLGLFGPGLLLIYGVLPFWGTFRQQAIYRKALPGLNASAVGLVVAAVLSLFIRVYENPVLEFPKAAVAIMIISYVAVEHAKCPAPLMVIGGGVLGIIAWATGCN